MLINPFFDKFRAKVNECAPQKRAAECLPPVKYWVSRHCSAIITAVGTLRSRSATSCAVVPGVSLGMLSTRPSRPTKVEEPPPSRLIASTHPSEIILSASSGSVIPALPRLLRPSQTTAARSLRRASAYVPRRLGRPLPGLRQRRGLPF